MIFHFQHLGLIMEVIFSCHCDAACCYSEGCILGSLQFSKVSLFDNWIPDWTRIVDD